jgi:hypothetical protein
LLNKLLKIKKHSIFQITFNITKEKDEKYRKKLKEEFEKISKKGYIKGICNNNSALGRTYSKSYITLFNATPDGKKLQDIERLKNIYGYPYKKDRSYKVLYANVYGDRKVFGGIKYQYKLEIE